MKTLRELNSEIIGGQIIKRVEAKPEAGDSAEDQQRKTIVPKSLNAGCINKDEVYIGNYKKISDNKKYTKEGDIVIKLSAPYNAVLIHKEDEDMLVSSYCAIIRSVKNVDTRYLVAYLNSQSVLKQILQNVAGDYVTLLSLNTLYNLKILIPSKEKQIEISSYFEKIVKNRRLLSRMIQLENEKLEHEISLLEEE